MARAPDQRVEQAQKLFDKGLKLIEIANQLGVPEGTVRSWKNRYKWNATLQSDKRNVAKKEIDKKNISESDIHHVAENPDLTDKQRLFCLYYICCFNATKAYQKAYECDYRTAQSNGHRLLTNAYIKKEIQSLKQNRLNREFLSEEDIFQKYMDIAFSDITDYVTFGTEEVPVMGAFGPVQVKDEETGEKKTLTKIVNVVRFRESHMIDGSLISEVKQGKDGASIKLLDKQKALQWLADHMDLATEEQKAKLAILRAKTQSDEEEIADDGFLEALNGTAAEDWSDEED